MMSDFDDRLSAVLAAEADDAPHGAGLAQAARRRHVVRRRRRIAAGGVAAALVIAAPVAVLAGGGDGDGRAVGNDQTAASSGEWQTVGQDDVRAEIPADWSRFTCDFDGFTSGRLRAERGRRLRVRDLPGVLRQRDLRPAQLPGRHHG